MAAEEAFRTEDMKLAAILVMVGCDMTLEKTNSRNVVFILTYADGRSDDIDDIIDAYNEYRYAVEPRSFHQELTLVRRKVYELSPPQRRPVASSAS